MPSREQSESLVCALRRILAQPAAVLFHSWHWKAALFSASLRALMFLFTTLKFGWRAVVGAMAAEFVLRIATTGFCGAFTQSLRYVQPAWQGAMVTLLVLPLTMQLLELGLHLLRGTPNLRAGVGVSTGFTILSTLFHVYATRQGAYLTGTHATSLGDDLRRTPQLLTGFLALRWCALDKTEKDGNVSADSPVLHQAARPRRPSCSR